MACRIVNEQEELSNYEYDQDSILDLENRLDKDSSWKEDDYSTESICNLVKRQEPFVEHVPDDDLMPGLIDQWPDNSSSDDNDSTIPGADSSIHLNRNVPVNNISIGTTVHPLLPIKEPPITKMLPAKLFSVIQTLGQEIVPATLMNNPVELFQLTFFFWNYF